MEVTLQIPDALYRKVKAEAAREGRTLREVTISLFKRWLQEGQKLAPSRRKIDWRTSNAPLAHLVPKQKIDSSKEAIRESIVEKWNEPT